MDESRNRKSDVIAWALARSTEMGTHIMVGDRANDVDGARANGLPCVGVLWGYGSVTELADATLLVHTPDELADVLLGRTW